jgi:hypothetical protein
MPTPMLRSGQFLFVVLVLLVGRVGWAQPSPNPTTQPIKQFEEFLKRLYYQQTPDQRPLTTDSLRALYPRQSYVLSLFDAKDPRRTESAYQRAVDAFATELADSPEKPVDLYAHLLAETAFRITFRGQSGVLMAYWKMVHVHKAQGWRLIGVKAPLLESSFETATPGADPLNDTKQEQASSADSAQPANRPLTLPPNAHETSFLSFHHLVKQGQDIQLVLSDSLRQTTAGRALVRAVRCHELIVPDTERVTFFVPTGPGWVVRVDEFPRNEANSGWLISDLYGPLAPAALPPELAVLLRANP